MEHVRRVNNKLLSLIEFGALTTPLGSHFRVSIAQCKTTVYSVHDASRTPPQHFCERGVTDSRGISLHGHCDIAGGKDFSG